MRNEPFETQVENMVESVAALQADHNFVIQQTKSQEAEIGTLVKRIAVLEGQTQKERMAKERLTAEKEFNQKFSQIQNYFNSNEAEVYRQGNQPAHRRHRQTLAPGEITISGGNHIDDPCLAGHR